MPTDSISYINSLIRNKERISGYESQVLFLHSLLSYCCSIGRLSFLVYWMKAVICIVFDLKDNYIVSVVFNCGHISPSFSIEMIKKGQKVLECVQY